MSHGANGAGPKKKLLQLLFPTTPLLGAMTVAQLSIAKDGMPIQRGVVTRQEEALPFCNLLLEITIQGVLAANAGKFKQFHSDKPVVICSQERADSEYAKRTDIRHLISEASLRCNEFPRQFQETKWVEPMRSDPESPDTLYRNAEWEAAKFEIELHCDPDKIFYDALPIELFRGKKSFLFYVSGAISVVEGGVEALIVVRNPVSLNA
jgi:hypothetical protein